MSKPKSIKELGKLVAQRILESERDAGKAAAILLLTALDGAYNSVLVVSYTSRVAAWKDSPY